MLPINNSDTAWLIVSDFNQDNDLPYEELREDIFNPEIHQWNWEHYADVVGGNYFFQVGDSASSVGDYMCLVGGGFADRLTDGNMPLNVGGYPTPCIIEI